MEGLRFATQLTLIVVKFALKHWLHKHLMIKNPSNMLQLFGNSIGLTFCFFSLLQITSVLRASCCVNGVTGVGSSAVATFNVPQQLRHLHLSFSFYLLRYIIIPSCYSDLGNPRNTSNSFFKHTVTNSLQTSSFSLKPDSSTRQIRRLVDESLICKLTHYLPRIIYVFIRHTSVPSHYSWTLHSQVFPPYVVRSQCRYR